MNRITPLTTKRPKVTKNLEIRVFYLRIFVYYYA
jgi:hypothetical protein